MITLTKEWLLKTIAELEEERDATPGAVNEDAANALAAMKLALASLEVEAVAFRIRLKAPFNCGEKWDYIEHRTPDRFELENCDIDRLYTAPPAPANTEPVAWLWSHRKNPSEVTLVRPEDDEKAEAALWSGWSCQALYAAPPAPAYVPDELAGKSFNYIANKFQVSISEAQWILVGWNAGRAAMLQGAEPVTKAYKLRDAVDAVRNSGIAIDAEKILAERDALNTPDCWCRTCRPVTMTDMRFIVCPECGNKRCPRANDHRNACTGSNEPGQEGSAYPAAPRQEVE